MISRLAFASLLASTPLGALAQSDPPAEAPPVNEIVVIGTRTPRPVKDSPVPVRVVDRAEIQAAGDETAADAMERIAGLHVDTAVRTGRTPQIQGFGSKHVLVLVDGRRASGRLADDFDLARIPASSIERIEVLKGATSVLYGSDAIGGVVNIVTRRPRRGFHGDVRYSRDSLHRDDAALVVSGGSEAVTAVATGAHQRGPAFDVDETDDATTGNAFARSFGKVEVAVRPRESLEVTTILTSEDATSEGVGLGAARSLLDRESRARGRSATLATRYRPADDAEVRLELSDAARVYGFVEDQRGGDRGDRRLDSEEGSRDASLLGSFVPAAGHQTVVGLEGGRQEFESSQMRQGGRVRDRTSVFAQHEWRPDPSVAVVPGVRYDDDSQFGDHVSKALTLRYDPTPEVVLRTSYGEGYRAPSFSELYLDFENLAVNYRVRGNEELRPERSRSVHASAAWQPDPELWLSLGAFANRVRDLITTVRSQPEGVLLVDYANVESVRNQGIEASTRARLARSLALGLDYTFLEARDETRGRTLEGRAMHSGSVQLRHEAPELGLTTAFVMGLVGKRPFYVESPAGQTTEWAKPYRAASLRVAKRFAASLEVFAGVRNLTNETQERLHPVPPRSFFGGVGATW